MVRWQFSKTKFRICAFILGNIIGFMMFRYLWTDSYFVNKYCESLLIDRKFVQIKLDSMIFFTIYYEMKKMIFLNFIGITKYRKYFIDIYIVYVGLTFMIQLCMLLKRPGFIFIVSVFIYILEKSLQLLYVLFIEKYMINYEQQTKTNIKYKCVIMGNLLFINIGFIGILSSFIAFIFKIIFPGIMPRPVWWLLEMKKKTWIL